MPAPNGLADIEFAEDARIGLLLSGDSPERLVAERGSQQVSYERECGQREHADCDIDVSGNGRAKRTARAGDDPSHA